MRAKGACISAIDDQATVQSGVAVEIDVLENDDPGLTITSTTPGTHGSADLSNNGVRDTVTYTSEPGFAGTDTFTYTVTDGNGGTATATVTVTVSSYSIVPQSASVNEGAGAITCLR